MALRLHAGAHREVVGHRVRFRAFPAARGARPCAGIRDDVIRVTPGSTIPARFLRGFITVNVDSDSPVSSAGQKGGIHATVFQAGKTLPFGRPHSTCGASGDTE